MRKGSFFHSARASCGIVNRRYARKRTHFPPHHPSTLATHTPRAWSPKPLHPSYIPLPKKSASPPSTHFLKSSLNPLNFSNVPSLGPSKPITHHNGPAKSSSWMNVHAPGVTSEGRKRKMCIPVRRLKYSCGQGPRQRNSRGVFSYNLVSMVDGGG